MILTLFVFSLSIKNFVHIVSSILTNGFDVCVQLASQLVDTKNY